MTDPAERRRQVFESIWLANQWGGAESRSGPGSGVVRTAPFRAALEKFLRRVDARVIYDAPCGDFHWMSHVSLPAGCAYIGADIVPALVDLVRRRYQTPGRDFRVADIVAEPPAAADVWLCRESLFHLSFEDALAVVAHWRRSSIRYFLATTTPTLLANTDVASGDWRMLNLNAPPFDLGDPAEVLPDGAPADPDKVIGVWTR